MLRFADDISRRPRKYRENATKHTLKQDYNMKTNKTKTNILVCSRLRLDCSVTVENIELESVNGCTHLGSKITYDGNSAVDINN